MKRIGVLALAPLAALAGCGQSEDSTNQISASDNAITLPEEVQLNDTPPAGPVNEAQPVQRPPDAEISIPPVKREVPRTVPKAPPPPPPPPPPKPDPHAGHDMSNMANSQ